jgi:hypothetical protein
MLARMLGNQSTPYSVENPEFGFSRDASVYLAVMRLVGAIHETASA